MGLYINHSRSHMEWLDRKKGFHTDDSVRVRFELHIKGLLNSNSDPSSLVLFCSTWKGVAIDSRSRDSTAK